jgi:hypothetical protein
MVFVARKDTMTRTPAIVSLASLLSIGTPAVMSAQPVATAVQWGQNNSRGDYQRSYDDGYRAGLREGDRDARSGRRPDVRQHDEFRRGSSGWGWGGGNDQRSTDVFRRGFAEGYQAGYDRYRGSANGYGRPGYPDGPYRSEGGYGGSYGLPNGTYGYPGSYGRSPASQRGFEDGYRDGSNDARDNDRYEPTRKKKYRDGDDGYNSRYGSRDQYRDEYRRSFQQGYDRGYREGRYR